MTQKRVLIISSSPRRHGNSDRLCDEFMRGAQEAGHEVEKVFLRDKKVNPCLGCGVCSRDGKPCPQRDDALEVIGKMLEADVLVFGTPVYFYAISAQMKTLIDRCCGPYKDMTDKEFYYLSAAAEDDAAIEQRITDSFQGFLDCLPTPVVRGTVFAGGVWEVGEIDGHPALRKAYETGLKV